MTSPELDREISPQETKALLDRGADVLLIDCRLPQEQLITTIDGAALVPLQALPSHLSDLLPHKDRTTVVYCRSGKRSLLFIEALRNAGFRDARSMAGGILHWNRTVNPGGPQY